VTDLHVLQQTALVRTMINTQRKDTLQNTGNSFGFLRTKVAKSVQALGPK